MKLHPFLVTDVMGRGLWEWGGDVRSGGGGDGDGRVAVVDVSFSSSSLARASYADFHLYNKTRPDAYVTEVAYLHVPLNLFLFVCLFCFFVFLLFAFLLFL